MTGILPQLYCLEQKPRGKDIHGEPKKSIKTKVQCVNINVK